MRRRITREIACEIEPLGGVKGISGRIPPKNALENVSRMHGVLSDPVRLRLLLALREGRLCVCVLREVVSCPDTRLSYHLSILRRARLISSARDGSYLRYCLTAGGRRVADGILKEAGKDA